MGPWLVTADEIADPGHLAIRCLVNGEVMQDSNTDQMIFGVAELVSFISQTITLEPGDVIATGTPPGVGFLRNPPRYLEDGDDVTDRDRGHRGTDQPGSHAPAMTGSPDVVDAQTSADQGRADHRRGVGHRRGGGRDVRPWRAGRSSSATSPRTDSARSSARFGKPEPPQSASSSTSATSPPCATWCHPRSRSSGVSTPSAPTRASDFRNGPSSRPEMTSIDSST